MPWVTPVTSVTPGEELAEVDRERDMSRVPDIAEHAGREAQDVADVGEEPEGQSEEEVRRPEGGAALVEREMRVRLRQQRDGGVGEATRDNAGEDEVELVAADAGVRGG